MSAAKHTPDKQRKRLLKEIGKRRISQVRDRLAEGAAPLWRDSFVLGSLQACAMRAGWGRERIQRAVYGMAERVPACVMHGRAAIAKATGSAALERQERRDV